MVCRRHQFRAAEKTKNTAQQLDRTPATVYKPRSQQKEYVSCDSYSPITAALMSRPILLFCWQAEHEKKKKEAGKRAKDDREVVLDLIFTAFQQHEYYNFKDLVQKTQQPVVSSPAISLPDP